MKLWVIKHYIDDLLILLEYSAILANMLEEKVMLLLHDPADNVTPNMLLAGRVLP